MKIGLLSLGCPKNLVDSEVMLGLARDAGHSVTHDAADAEVLIVNTCAFIESAKQESVNAILEMAELKRSGACRRLVVTGCLAERYREELRDQIPDIDVVLGTGEVPDIVGAIGAERVLQPCGPAVDTAEPHGRATVAPTAQASPVQLFNATGEPIRARSARHRAAAASRQLPTYLYDAATPRLLTTPAHYAYVKIAEGCDYNCAFCIIPSLRGAYRSRPVESVVDEAHSLAARGVRELILISQDTTFYGTDRRDRGALSRLLRQLSSVDGIEWIRLLYLYPTTITAAVLEAMAELPKICKYIDLPLQHSAPAVLKRMRRPGSRSSYERLLERIRATVPGVTLRTTLIVGFPGETEADFADLVDFVETVDFDHLGVFTYSHEEGTAAHALPDGVPPATKRRRQRELMRRQQRMLARRNRSRKGERVRLMVDGPSKEHELVVEARLPGQAPEIDSVVYLTDCDSSQVRAGELIDATITGARGYDLVAMPLSESIATGRPRWVSVSATPPAPSL